jgi:hypothetical protein
VVICASGSSTSYSSSISIGRFASRAIHNGFKFFARRRDAHTYIGAIDNISKMIAFEDDFGVSTQIGIVHDEG